MKGIAVSKGVAIGKVYMLDSSKFCILKHQLDESEAEKEVERFRNAIKQTKPQMLEIKKRAKKIADKYAVILDTYNLLLDDDILVNETIDRDIISTWPMNCPAYKKQLPMLFRNVKPSQYFMASCNFHFLIYARHHFHLGDTLAQLCWIEREVN